MIIIYSFLLESKKLDQLLIHPIQSQLCGKKQ